MHLKKIPPLLIPVMLVLAGCQSGPFSGASTMRIDVEVYKGPLAEQPEVQWGVLLGHLKAARKALLETDNFTRAVIANKGFHSVDEKLPEWPYPPRRIMEDETIQPISDDMTGKLCSHVKADGAWYELKFWRLFGLLDDMDHYDCQILETLVSDMGIVIETLDAIIYDKFQELFPHEQTPHVSLDNRIVRAMFQEVANFASLLRGNAFRWAIASTAGQSLNFKVRIAAVNGIVAMSEIGNQLKCRVNALSMQMDDKAGLDRRELPPSLALCEAEPTNFVNLYSWYDASMPSLLGKYWAGVGWVQERIKIVKDLFGDHNWSRTNTVYASGRGKTSMAFIKDDVGNWNLKSFANDPEDLVNAYTDFSLEAIKRAAKAVQQMSPAGPLAQVPSIVNELMDLADRNVLGEGSSTQVSSANLIRIIHTETTARLSAVAETYAKKDDELLSDYKKSLAERGNNETRVDEAQISDVTKALIAHRQKAFKEMEQVLNEHRSAMSLLSLAQTKNKN